MTLVYTSKLGFQVYCIDVKTQKIDGSILKTFKIVLVSFQAKYKLRKTRFFQKIFLLTDTSVEMVLEMPFLTFSNANIQFKKKKFTQRTYTAAKALSTTKWVELINKKEFIKTALDKNSKIFLVHISALQVLEMIIHLL